MTIGERINLWRVQAGLPRGVVEYLSREGVFISAFTLEKIEDGLIEPSDKIIYRLSQILEVPLSYFFTDPVQNRPFPLGYCRLVPQGKTAEELLEIYRCDKTIKANW